MPSCPEDPLEKSYYGLTRVAWAKIAVIAVLMAALFRFNLMRLWLKTNPFFGEANWSHSICVPLIGLYYLYINREQLLKAPVKTAWSGLGILVLGIVIFLYGIWPGQNDYTKDLGMVVTLFGVVAFMCGWRVMKIAWFPIIFLVCALPWPGLVYSWVASPLQELAAKVAVNVLQMTGVDAGNYGTRIIIGINDSQVRALNVAEACAGLRSLMTFIAVGAAVAFLSSRPMWQKLLITASAVPIAIFCNVMRVTGQGILDYYVSQELSQNFAHQFVGLIMLLPAFFLILLVGWFLDHSFIEDTKDSDYLIAGKGTAPVARPVAVTPPAVSAGPARTGFPTPPRPMGVARPPMYPPRPKSDASGEQAGGGKP